MALKIRLSRGGAKKRPHYRIVVTDSRSPRDGRFIEKLGYYDPLRPADDEKRVVLDAERARHWLDRGAKPSERVARFLGKAGVIPMPPIPDRPNKSKPKAKAQERMREAAEAAAAAKEAPKDDAPADDAGAAEGASE